MKKNILIYNGSLRMGGIERVLIEVLQNLNKEKYNIDLIIEDGIKSLNVFEKDIPSYINLNYLKNEDQINKIKYYRDRKKNSFFDRIKYQVVLFYDKVLKKKRLKQLVKGKKYDVVIDFDMDLSKFINLIETKKRIAWVHTDIEKWYAKKSRIKRLGNRLKKYEQIVTICNEMEENTKNLFPFLKNKITRIYNPFNFEKIEILSNENIDINLKSYLERDYIVSVMRLTTLQKDFKTLIKAFKVAKESGMKEKLYILGDGPDKKQIENLIAEENLKEEIFLLGSIKNPYPWIKNAKALVHSSKYEGFGLVLVEALILGTKVISSNCPTGPKEILDYGNMGELYDTGNHNELVSILLTKLNQNLKIDKKQIEKYNIENVIKEYEKIIDSN